MGRPRKKEIRLEKKPDGEKSYRAHIYVNGKRKRYWLDTTNLNLAKERAEGLRKKTINSTGGPTLQEKYDEFIRDRDRSTKPVTVIYYETKLPRFIEYLSKHTTDFSQVTRDIVRGYRSTFPESYSGESINAFLRAAKIFLNHFEHDAVRAIKLVKKPSRKPMRIIEEDDYHKLLEVAEDQFKRILQVLWHTGVRAAELCRLKWEDIDFKEKIMLVKGKTKTRYVAIPRIVDMLKEIQGEGYVFPGRHGIRSARALTGRIAELCKRAEINHYSCHDFRKTLATRMLRAGVSETLIRDQLGHVHIDTTMKHYFKLENDQRRAAMMMV